SRCFFRLVVEETSSQPPSAHKVHPGFLDGVGDVLDILATSRASQHLVRLAQFDPVPSQNALPIRFRTRLHVMYIAMTDTPEPPWTGGASSQALIASILTVFLISIAVTAYVAHRSSRFEPIREAVRVRMAGFRFSRGLDPDLIARIPIVKYHDGPVAKD